MKRRSFLSLALTALVPAKHTVFLSSSFKGISNPIVLKLTMNSMYGKFYGGKRERFKAGQLVTTDIVSAYPASLT